MKYFIYTAFLLLGVQYAAAGQSFFRLSGDFSIREIFEYEYLDSLQSYLTMGKVDYDMKRKQILYDVQFPDRESWVLQDSVFYKINSDTVYNKQVLPYAVHMQDFDLLLSGSDYDGVLQAANATLVDVKEENDNIFKLWKYPDLENMEILSYILVQQQGNKTVGIAFLDEKKEVMSRQYYKEYAMVDGLNLPHLIEQQIYSDSMTYVKKLKFKNVSINNLERSSVFRDDLEFLPLVPGADKGNIREELEFPEE